MHMPTLVRLHTLGGRMRILYLDIDTLSPRHMGCYGYNRDTTPNIDKIANDSSSAIFQNMYTSDAPCLPSRTSLLTGQFGIHHGAVDHGGKYADLRSELMGRDFQHALEDDGLFGLFKRAGFKTVSVSSFSSRHSSWHFNAGFNEVYCYGDSAIQQAEEIQTIASDWLTRNGQEDDWLLHVHVWDPHTPYRAPDDYHPDFLDENFDYFINDKKLSELQKLTGPHTATTTNMYMGTNDSDYTRDIGQINTHEDLKTVIDGYDVGIHYADHHIGLIINQLKEMGIYDDVMIVVSADHGENMGELGKFSEHGTADVATCHIPFIIKVPGKDYSTQTFDAFHYNIDVVPTVAEYLDLKPINKNTRWDGTSFLNCLNEGVDTGHDFLVLSQMSHVLQRSVRFDNYLYIQTYHDGYHTYFEPEMLFNLKEDFYEQDNIAKTNKNIVDQAKVILFDWYNQQMSTLKHGHCEDPLWYIFHNGGPHHAHQDAGFFVKNLEDVGQTTKAKEVRQRYNQEFTKGDYEA